jgi:hypothetical protein
MNEETDMARCVAVFESKYTELQEAPMKRSDCLHRVAVSIQRFRPNALQALTIAIAELSDTFGGDASISPDGGVARRIIAEAANLLEGSVGAQHVLENVLRTASSDRFATDVLNDHVPANRAIPRGQSIVDKDMLEKAFRERMRTKYTPGGSFSFFPNEGAVNIVPLGRWALCSGEGPKEVHEYLLREFQVRHSNIGRFLAVFFPVIEVDPFEDPRTGDPLATIAKYYFPLEELAKLLGEFGDSAASSPEEVNAIRKFRSKYRSAQS